MSSQAMLDLKIETPKERYERRWEEEIEVPAARHKQYIEAKRKEIINELEAVQGKCNPCKGDGGMFEEFCKLCGVSFG